MLQKEQERGGEVKRLQFVGNLLLLLQQIENSNVVGPSSVNRYAFFF